MDQEVIIGGRKVTLVWTVESAKRFAYRMGEIGGEPTGRQLTNPKTVTTALFKVLWGLLPPVEFARHSSPEDLFAAVDHESESDVIFEALKAIYQERQPPDQKKTSSKNSPSHESSSA